MKNAPEPLRRVATILDAVGFSRDGLSSAQIAEVTGLPMPTVHRTLRNLVALEYLENSGLGTPYKLGDRLRRLLEPGLRNEDIAQLAQPLLQRLADNVGCVAAIARIGDFTVETVAEAMPTERGRSLILSGTDLPLHATAGGKIFLSMLDEDELAAYMKPKLASCRPATIVDPDELRAHLDLVRRRGFATCRDECDPGVYSIAVPVVISPAGPTFTVGVVDLRERLFERVEEEGVLQMVRAAAQELSARLTGLRPASDTPTPGRASKAAPKARARATQTRRQRGAAAASET